MSHDSLYERLGGAAAVETAVTIFYKKILADSTLKRFFEGVDMGRQTQHQINFMTYAFGGPNRYAGKGLRYTHARLVKEEGLDERHFERVAAYLQDTLQELRVPSAMIQEVLQLVAKTKADVLGL